MQDSVQMNIRGEIVYNSIPDDGGPAFPTQPTQSPGMSLRDFFAASAMDSCLSQFRDDDFNRVATDVYRLADAMLKARKR